jgi:hypothetical protein
MTEVSTDGGGHGNAGPGEATGAARRCRAGPGAGGCGGELVSAALREDEGELGVHVGFLSMASTSSQNELRRTGAHRENAAA